MMEDGSGTDSLCEGATVRIIKGTNKDKCGPITRTTSKSVWVYIPGMSKNVIKKRSFVFLQILDDAILHRDADDEARDEEKENVILDMSQRMNDNVDFDSSAMVGEDMFGRV